jgi:hypothetical protein
MHRIRKRNKTKGKTGTFWITPQKPPETGMKEGINESRNKERQEQNRG